MSEEGPSRSKSGDVPQAPATEASVLGACLSEGTAWWNQVVRMAGPDATALFYTNEYHLIARAIHKTIESGADLNDSAVEDQLEMMNAIDMLVLEARQYLIQLQANTSITNMKSLHAAVNTLIQKNAARKMLTGIERIRQDIVTGDKESPMDISREMTRVATTNLVSREVRTLGDVMQALSERTTAPWNVPTGLKEVDEIIGGGFEPGHNYCIAARPKIGKTTMMMNMISAALDSDTVVIAVSMETLEQDFLYKMLSTQSWVSQMTTKDLVYSKINLDDIEDPEDRDEIVTAQDFLKSAPLYSVFPNDLPDGFQSLVGIIASIKAKHEGRKIVVFADYLQLFVQNRAFEYQELSQYTRDFKTLAMEMEIPIVYLSQLSREGADGSMPSPHHLRGSGTIEQDASVVIMLNRQHHYDDTKPKHILDIAIPLNRNGASGKTIQAHWNGEKNVIDNLEDATGWKVQPKDEEFD